MARKTKWVIFDADNTLWDVESLYNSARNSFCKYALEAINSAGENKAGHVTLELLEKAQHQRDIQLYKTYGYSSARFARSFEDTLLFFMPYAAQDAIIHVRYLAQNTFDQRPHLADNLETILSQLAEAYSLAIITAGEKWVQEKRIAEFHLRDKFKEILVVERKTAQVFRNFCVEHGIPAECCWVVGDSVRSDIRPAIDAGLKAIHIQATNWAVEHEPLPLGVESVTVLNEIVELLLD
jgi:putative hydrolase of the HAD superfamily